jgi:hypothetical protein
MVAGTKVVDEGNGVEDQELEVRSPEGGDERMALS